MKDTIKAKNGYKFRKFNREAYGKSFYCKGVSNSVDNRSYLVDEETRILLDGDNVVMICQLIPEQEHAYQKNYNECYCFQERFTTVNGKQYEYYLDIETNEDFIVRIA